jgi:hypothetical protein
MQPEYVEQKLRDLAAFEQQQIASETQMAMEQRQSSGPSLARMYTAILREDFSSAERDAIQADPGLDAKYEKVKGEVWYPTLEELREYVNGETTDQDLKEQIQYHLETDQCRQSLRQVRWLKSLRRVQEDVGRVATIARDLVASVSIARSPRKLAPTLGFASETENSSKIIDDETMKLVWSRPKGTYRCSSGSLPVGTVIQVEIRSDADQPAWQRFLVLWKTMRYKSSTGKCAACSPDDLDEATQAHHTVICRPVTVDELSDEHVVDLESSWAWTREHEPDASTQWKSFAEKLSQSKVASLRELGARIQGEASA